MTTGLSEEDSGVIDSAEDVTKSGMKNERLCRRANYADVMGFHSDTVIC